jgi:hypothetical protein
MKFQLHRFVEMRMTDPSVGMKSFQRALKSGRIIVSAACTDPDLFVHLDAPHGPPELRYTYVRLKGIRVTALAMFAAQPPIEGKLCFTVGYAVPKALRRQGRAKDVLVAGIADMQAGLARTGFPEFYLEAVVAADNLASQRIAEQTISDKPEAITEGFSGLPAFKYRRSVTQMCSGSQSDFNIENTQYRM